MSYVLAKTIWAGHLREDRDCWQGHTLSTLEWPDCTLISDGESLTWRLAGLEPLTQVPGHRRLDFDFHPDYEIYAEEVSPLNVYCLWVLPNSLLILRKTLEDEKKYERIGLCAIPARWTLDCPWQYLDTRDMTVEIV
jgi:hypothetical protein